MARPAILAIESHVFDVGELGRPSAEALAAVPSRTFLVRNVYGCNLAGRAAGSVAFGWRRGRRAVIRGGRARVWLVWAGILVLSGAPVGCATRSNRSTSRLSHTIAVEFNQAKLGVAPRVAPVVSVHSASATEPGSKQPVAAPDFAVPRSVLRFVLASAPPAPVVYPTEMYYYYNFPLGPRAVSGNIRFVDAIHGAISVGYFDSANTRDMHVQQFKDGQDGVRIISEDPWHVSVEADGVQRRFTLDRSALTEQPPFPLLAGERFISGVRDESGYYLCLIYFQPERSFYYVVNPERPRPESWQRGESDKVETYFGEQSRFCFVKHQGTGRHILVGVLSRNIEVNNWYDGPFDQVPPRLPIGDVLEEAYPYVKDAGGIDAHGNFVKLPGQRIAISPYLDYRSGPELEIQLEGLITSEDSPRAWCRATYEWKRDWRPTVGPEGMGHQKAVSGAWPANHWGPSSKNWASDHQTALSLRWPSSHAAQSSVERK